jgi:flagellar assembly factor FliW
MTMLAEPAVRTVASPAGAAEVRFVTPLLGFPKLERYRLSQPKAGPMWWLESLQQADVNFCLLAPFAAGLDPDLQVAPDDITDVGAASVAEVEVYTMVVLDKDPSQMRTNLRAPVLVCRRTGLAKQVVLPDVRLPIRFFLRDIPAARSRGGRL